MPPPFFLPAHKPHFGHPKKPLLFISDVSYKHSVFNPEEKIQKDFFVNICAVLSRIVDKTPELYYIWLYQTKLKLNKGGNDDKCS